MPSKGNGQCFTARLSCSSVSIHPPFIRCTPFYDVTEIHVHVKHELHFYNLHFWLSVGGIDDFCCFPKFFEMSFSS
ncbi:hypothetical protein T02_3608 [Trichinella nativa]|uniref:Uncharacterized protein n=1 Tax=Trichinella nativa TaxID=6335 RepID=A0A0V1LM00_9BILA|nr:hypothetical protein T02_3608 [Trichinella nativa]